MTRQEHRAMLRAGMNERNQFSRENRAPRRLRRARAQAGAREMYQNTRDAAKKVRDGETLG